MRVKPSVALAVILWLLYTTVWIGTAALLQPDDADFENAFADLANSRYLAVGLLAGVAFGAVVATLFGWWKAILADDRRSIGPVRGWHRFLPLIVIAVVLATTDYPAFGGMDGQLLAWILAAALLVGVSEELMFRGNVVVALRRTPVPEVRVWLISSTLFALIHLPNIVLGAPAAAAIGNTVLAFMGGTVFYAVRRASGSILVAMAIHALWDFTLFTAEESTLGAIRTPLSIALFVALVVTRKNLFGVAPAEDEPKPRG